MAKGTTFSKQDEKTTEAVVKHAERVNAEAIVDHKFNELAKQDDPRMLEAKKLEQTIDAFILGKKLSDTLSKEQVALCKQTALSFGLNPLKREIHFVPRAVKKQINGQWNVVGYDVNIIVGYEVYLKRAEVTGRLQGWGVTFSPEKDIVGKPDLKATITIYKKGWQSPFTHEVYMSEARQDNSPVWTKMPRFQLRKVAISQGFRLAFPEEIGGMPYIPEEIGIGQTDNDGNFVEDKKPEVKPPPPAPKITEQQADKVMVLLDAKGRTVEDLHHAIDVAFKKKELRDITQLEAERLLVKLNSLPDKEDIIDNDEAEAAIEKMKKEGEKKA